jgi:hypothetical protein
MALNAGCAVARQALSLDGRDVQVAPLFEM